MTCRSESLQTTKPATSLVQAWLEKPGTGACSHSIHGNTTSIWSQHAWKCGSLGGLGSDLWWGLWQMTSSLFGERVTALRMPQRPPSLQPPTSVCPQLLGEPQCTYGGIPDTTLKQQGTKQQQPDSWSCLVKEQAGQRSSSRVLIPPALWGCRPGLYSLC